MRCPKCARILAVGIMVCACCLGAGQAALASGSDDGHSHEEHGVTRAVEVAVRAGASSFALSEDYFLPQVLPFRQLVWQQLLYDDGNGITAFMQEIAHTSATQRC